MLDLADERAALFGEQRRRVVEVGALGRHLGDARLDGRDLRSRALLADLPFVAFGRYRLQAAIREFGLARQRLRFGAHLRGEPAMAVDLGPYLAKLRLGVEARRQFGQRRRGASCAAAASMRSAVEAALRFGQRRAARGVAVDLALGAA